MYYVFHLCKLQTALYYPLAVSGPQAIFFIISDYGKR